MLPVFEFHQKKSKKLHRLTSTASWQKVLNINEKLDFSWSILQKGTSIGYFCANDDQIIRNFFVVLELLRPLRSMRLERFLRPENSLLKTSATLGAIFILRKDKGVGGRQTMTKAEHNRPNPKLFGNRPSASAAELFCETIRPIVSQNIVKKILRIVSFLWLLSWEEAWLKKS